MKHVTDKEVEECLNTHYACLEEGMRWQTPFGISFARPEYNTKRPYKIGWYCLYDKEVDFAGASDMMEINGYKAQWLQPDEVLRVVKKCAKKPNDYTVFDKTDALLMLEKVLQTKARLHALFALQWHLTTPDISCLHNPFGLTGSHADNEREFEVLFTGEEDPIDYVSLSDLIAQLKTRELIPPSTWCRGCDKILVDKALLACSRCKKSYYCNTACQTLDWKTRHRALCVKKI